MPCSGNDACPWDAGKGLVYVGSKLLAMGSSHKHYKSSLHSKVSPASSLGQCLRCKEPLMAFDLLHAGVIQENGMVKCAQHVGGPQNHECSLSEFEKLGNSKERRPGENIHLTTFSLALKVVEHPFTTPLALVMHMAGSCIDPLHCAPFTTLPYLSCTLFRYLPTGQRLATHYLNIV